jgi:S2P endopeptidase
MLTLTLTLSLMWAAIHSLDYLFRHSRSRLLLPTPFLRIRYPFLHSTKVILKRLHLRVETTAWNSRHHDLASLLVKKRTLARVLRLFYDMGSVFGIMGTIGSLCIILWTCKEMSAPFLGMLSLYKTSHMKRSIASSSTDTGSSFLEPIVRPRLFDFAALMVTFFT